MTTLAELATSAPMLVREARIRWGDKLVLIAKDTKGGSLVEPILSFAATGANGNLYIPEFKLRLIAMLLSPDPEQYIIDNPGVDK